MSAVAKEFAPERQIHLAHLTQNAVPFTREGLYEFQPEGKWPWLQRLCFWILGKLIQPFIDTKIQIERSVIDLDDLVKAITANRFDVEMIYRQEARYLIIGYDKWAELNGRPDFHGQFTFPLDFRAQVGYNNQPLPYLFRGLEVVVVPWIDGMFVLPDIAKHGR